jgi:Protein of unknown function (DUF4238)
MNNKPRVHHFVPQFWIKKFISADGNLWGYEWNDDRIKQRSPKAMMQVFDLYTIQPSGVDDTSLETNELGAIDDSGAKAFDRVLSGDLDESVRLELATFLAAQSHPTGRGRRNMPCHCSALSMQRTTRHSPLS